MIDRQMDSKTQGEAGQIKAPAPSARVDPRRKRSLSMHDGIAVWCDCCTCEAEPYWVNAMREMGLELGSDYEDEAIDH